MIQSELIKTMFGAVFFFVTFFTAISYLGRVTIFAWLAQVQVKRSDYFKCVFWCSLAGMMTVSILCI